jgi:hypothetical protein
MRLMVVSMRLTLGSISISAAVTVMLAGVCQSPKPAIEISHLVLTSWL